jgi:hypothetical protein
MAVFGLLAWMLARYLARPSSPRAFCAGIAVGLGVWARANFIWLLVAMWVAAVVVWRRGYFTRWWHHAAALAGALLGSLPFIAYQVISRGGTWEAWDLFRETRPWGDLLSYRLVLLAQSLLSDAEHRLMWGGPPMPFWQLWLFPSVALAGCAVCLAFPARREGRFVRAVAIALFCLAALLFSSRLQVAEHHFVVLAPLAAAVVVLACSLVLASRRRWWPTVAALAAVYAASALYWQVSAVRGLYKTGGVGPWSDAVYVLSRDVERRFFWRDLFVLDWGLFNNLYVLSDGDLHGREIYAGATGQAAQNGRPWRDVVARGGVFVMNGPEHGNFSVAAAGFLKALRDARPDVRHTVFTERNGTVYAEIYDVLPAPVTPAGASSTTPPAGGPDRGAGSAPGTWHITPAAAR